MPLMVPIDCGKTGPCCLITIKVHFKIMSPFHGRLRQLCFEYTVFDTRCHSCCFNEISDLLNMSVNRQLQLNLYVVRIFSILRKENKKL